MIIDWLIMAFFQFQIQMNFFVLNVNIETETRTKNVTQIRRDQPIKIGTGKKH